MLRAAGFGVRAPPDGAYYVFAGYADVPALRGLAPREAAMAMTERHGVACVPGDNFYLGAARADPQAGDRYLRFAFVRSLDVLHAAAERLGAMRGRDVLMDGWLVGGNLFFLRNKKNIREKKNRCSHLGLFNIFIRKLSSFRRLPGCDPC